MDRCSLLCHRPAESWTLHSPRSHPVSRLLRNAVMRRELFPKVPSHSYEGSPHQLNHPLDLSRLIHAPSLLAFSQPRCPLWLPSAMSVCFALFRTYHVHTSPAVSRLNQFNHLSPSVQSQSKSQRGRAAACHKSCLIIAHHGCMSLGNRARATSERSLLLENFTVQVLCL